VPPKISNVDMLHKYKYKLWSLNDRPLIHALGRRVILNNFYQIINKIKISNKNVERRNVYNYKSIKN